MNALLQAYITRPEDASDMTGHVYQLNTSRGGLPKLPVSQAFVGPLGLETDAHAHPKIHGGPRQAVLCIAKEVIDQLCLAGFPVYPGALGENVTTAGVDYRTWRTGQRWRIGEVTLEFTKVRAPCKQLDVYSPALQAALYDARVKAGDPASPLWARSGFYAAVVLPGMVRQGDIIAFVDQAV